jgi:CheY-like chemotaxis protein
MSNRGYETTFVAGQTLKVLMLEDCQRDVELCVRILTKAEFTVESDVVSTAEEFSSRLESNEYDIILADYNLPSWNALEALEMLQQLNEDIPFILVTGVLAEETALEFISKGADDYILKDRLGRLPLAVRRVLREQRLLEERQRATVERERLIMQLQEIAEEVKRLNGLLPICMRCKKILDAKGQWHRIELYIQKHSRGSVSPCICPECSKRVTPRKPRLLQPLKKAC